MQSHLEAKKMAFQQLDELFKPDNQLNESQLTPEERRTLSLIRNTMRSGLAAFENLDEWKSENEATLKEANKHVENFLVIFRNTTHNLLAQERFNHFVLKQRFYTALLILARAWPRNNITSPPEGEQGEPGYACPVNLNIIKPEDVIETGSGYQFDSNFIIPYIQNGNFLHPVTRVPFLNADIERIRFKAREKNPAEPLEVDKLQCTLGMLQGAVRLFTITSFILLCTGVSTLFFPPALVLIIPMMIGWCCSLPIGAVLGYVGTWIHQKISIYRANKRMESERQPLLERDRKLAQLHHRAEMPNERPQNILDQKAGNRDFKDEKDEKISLSSAAAVSVQLNIPRDAIVPPLSKPRAPRSEKAKNCAAAFDKRLAALAAKEAVSIVITPAANQPPADIRPAR